MDESFKTFMDRMKEQAGDNDDAAKRVIIDDTPVPQIVLDALDEGVATVGHAILTVATLQVQFSNIRGLSRIAIFNSTAVQMLAQVISMSCQNPKQELSIDTLVIGFRRALELAFDAAERHQDERK